MNAGGLIEITPLALALYAFGLIAFGFGAGCIGASYHNQRDLGRLEGTTLERWRHCRAQLSIIQQADADDTRAFLREGITPERYARAKAIAAIEQTINHELQGR